MSTLRCPAKIKVWHKSDGEFQCRITSNSPHDVHQATGLFVYQTISWLDSDRRQFRGVFMPCDESTCLLPAGHRGNHTL